MTDIATLQDFIALPFQDRWGSVETEAQDALERLEEQLEAAEQRLHNVLTVWYMDDAVKVAKLCDEVLDPSGALLGRIRYGKSNPAKRCALEVPHPAHKWDTGPSGAGSCPGLASNQETKP